MQVAINIKNGIPKTVEGKMLLSDEESVGEITCSV
jgi:hypothetical protein